MIDNTELRCNVYLNRQDTLTLMTFLFGSELNVLIILAL